MFQFSQLPPLSLYVHVPWCVRKCPYCDFNSHQTQGELPEAAYVDALLADLEHELSLMWGRGVGTVFIGGGTPSLFSPQALDRLLGGIRARLRLAPDAEITLEANPGTVEQGRFREYRAAGINRLSIGIQSFDDTALRTIGRIHGRREAIAAAEAAHHAGFDNFNLDLMFGLPGQDPDAAVIDLQQAIALGPSHLSYYQLTIEPNTAFHHRPPVTPDDDTLWAMQQQGQERLAAAGYGQYEVSAYAQAGWRCRHNLNYWQFGDYLGIGAGAHGKISSSAPQGIQRRWKLRGPQDYLQNAHRDGGLAGSRFLEAPEAAFEFMLNGLRLVEGVERTLFQGHTGLELSVIAAPLARALELGLMEADSDYFRPTERGRLYLNDLLELFLPD